MGRQKRSTRSRRRWISRLALAVPQPAPFSAGLETPWHSQDDRFASTFCARSHTKPRGELTAALMDEPANAVSAQPNSTW